MTRYAIKLTDGSLWHDSDGEIFTWGDIQACNVVSEHLTGSTAVEVHVTIAEVKPPKSMFISLGGVLGRAADECGTNLAFSVNELHKHLEELRADPSKVHELFQLWVK